MSALAFVQNRVSARKVVLTDVTGKVLHVGDRVVTFKRLDGGKGKAVLVPGRIVRLTPIRADIMEDESGGYLLYRIPSQLSRID